MTGSASVGGLGKSATGGKPGTQPGAGIVHQSGLGAGNGSTRMGSTSDGAAHGGDGGASHNVNSERKGAGADARTMAGSN